MQTWRCVVLGLALGSLSACTSIGSGKRAIEWVPSRGTLQRPLDEGFHMVSPFSQIYTYDLRDQEHREYLQVLANNGLAIQLDTSVIYRPLPHQLYQLQTEVGPNYYDVLIEPLLRSGARKVVGRYSPEEIYSTKREEVEREIRMEIERNLQGHHIQIDALLIRDVHLPKIVENAIEQKLKEEQNALAMKFVIDKEVQEAERKRIQAEGIAKYQEIITHGLTPAILEWRKIQAMEKLADSPNSKTIVLGDDKNGSSPLLLSPQVGP